MAEALSRPPHHVGQCQQLAYEIASSRRSAHDPLEHGVGDIVCAIGCQENGTTMGWNDGDLSLHFLTHADELQ